jgi:hypothetical protein
MVALFMVLVGLVVLVSVVSVFFADKVAAVVPFLAAPLALVKSAVLWVATPVVAVVGFVMKPVSALFAKLKSLF